MKIIPLLLENKNYIKQCAMLLKTNFKDFSNIEIAKKAILNSIDDNKISIIAVDEDNKVLGWICGVEEYNAHVWEIQPLVVHKENQGNGIGKLLICKFEKLVALRGGVTIILGTQDEDNSTSLSGKDIYPDIFKQIENIKNLNHHTYEFCLKLGYKIVGVIPDSNGFGKPDILMAKRVICN
ncbi:GNAT family N-acetyltransferase [Clostridium uliginosum]|uniref:Aminoglycoside 6'-N-acetyltransferase I n=1 Tax=Clostridium uliginosum TaxID=119641 RepID=A0A1I1R6F9_9CLOT|nr:GNAT family N-acetyltransferase [Clostridium uliginosum]SFD27748.1 aminoglycoside 6'-N-acetyltransferase I [Clostridium uliginosum]